MNEGKIPTASHSPLSAFSPIVYGSEFTPGPPSGPFQSDAAPPGPYESDEKAINRPPMVQELNSPPPANVELPERCEIYELGSSSTRDRNAGEARVRRSYLDSWSSPPAETPDKGKR